MPVLCVLKHLHTLLALINTIIACFLESFQYSPLLLIMMLIIPVMVIIMTNISKYFIMSLISEIPGGTQKPNIHFEHRQRPLCPTFKWRHKDRCSTYRHLLRRRKSHSRGLPLQHDHMHLLFGSSESEQKVPNSVNLGIPRGPNVRYIHGE